MSATLLRRASHLPEKKSVLKLPYFSCHSCHSCKKNRKNKKDRNFPFSIFNFQFPRECISRSRCKACDGRGCGVCSAQMSNPSPSITQQMPARCARREWVLRGAFCATQASKSAVCWAQMRKLRCAVWCKKHPQGTLAILPSLQATRTATSEPLPQTP